MKDIKSRGKPFKWCSKNPPPLPLRTCCSCVSYIFRLLGESPSLEMAGRKDRLARGLTVNDVFSRP
ncbi:hypothetical protein J6590_068280 [Homalodisca vitripennis]|nr:hypothetical protein J6590_068280 [Homalodisca vitripennis]